MPQLTLAELGILRDVSTTVDGGVLVTITPTYSGCPALATIRDDLLRALHEAGFAEVTVRAVLAPAWTSDWITGEGRRKLAAAGISPPGPARSVPLTLFARRPDVACPRCGSTDTSEIAGFGATACRALRRCAACGEPFDHVKEV